MNVSEHYDRLIEEDNDPFRDPPVLRQYMDKWDGRPFLDSLRLDESRDVLEVGVGTGRLAARVAPYCRRLTGIDISPKTIRRAGENLSGFRNISLICGDFLEYPFAERFDVVYSSLTLMHFEDKARFIRKADGLLKESGTFVLSIDRNQSDIIDTGTRQIRIYPDTPDRTAALIGASSMTIVKTIGTEFAHIFVCTK